MFKDIKLGLKLIKYTFNFKYNMVVIVVTMLIGILAIMHHRCTALFLPVYIFI